jgi:hypothetical protein
MNLHGLGTDQHPVLGQVNYRVHDLGWNPDEQVGRTIQVMRERVAEDSTDPQFVSRARGVVDSQGTPANRTQQVWDHVKGAIQFKRDESTGIREDGLGIGGSDPGDIVEVIIRPRDMAQYIDQGIAIGDCDDFSMYLAAMLKAVDVPCSFCTVAASPSAPNQYSHVYVVAYPDGQRVPCDASHGQYCGWEVENQFGKRDEWPVYDRTRLFLGNLVVNAAVVAGLWFGWQYLRKGWA